LQTELAEEKSLHSQKLPRWAQQIYVTKEKSRYSECYKKVLYVGPKYLDKLKHEPSPTRKTGPDITLHRVKSFILIVLIAW